MLFTSPEQFLVLAVLLLGGWLLGYASAPNARKWKRRVREQSDSFTAYHGDAEDKVRAANQRAADLKAEADALRADHAEAEQTIAALRAAAAAPAPRPGLAPVEAMPAATAPEATLPDQVDSAAAQDGAAEPEVRNTGWFATSPRDELARIRGIDAALNTRLSALGVTRFEDLERISAEDEMALEQRLALPVGYIAREQWRTQAALLRAGKDAEHAAHFGAAGA